MVRLSWKSVLANKVRLMLTAIAIVLGVAFVAGWFGIVLGVRAVLQARGARKQDGIESSEQLKGEGVQE